MYKYTLFNVEKKNIAELISTAAMINKVRDIVFENGDTDFSILGISDAKEYIEDYCPNLVLLEVDRINNFLTEFGIEVRENEPMDYVELMMDNHKCIQFQGKQFYISEDSPMTADEEIIYNTLIDCCHV
jgi:hypothetical protein